MAAVPSTVVLEPKSVTVFIVFPSIWLEVMGLDAVILVFWMLSFKSAFPLSFHFHQEALYFLFTFCHKGGVICISEVIDISPSNLDSSLYFIQSNISHDVLLASQVVLVVKNAPANAGDKRDSGSIPELGRFHGEENSNPLQYSCLENPMDKGAWQGAVQGVAKRWTQLKWLST